MMDMVDGYRVVTRTRRWPGFYGFEQQTINGSRFTWIPTRQRWELSGGTLYNEQLDKNPEQVRQEVLRDGHQKSWLQEIDK